MNERVYNIGPKEPKQRVTREEVAQTAADYVEHLTAAPTERPMLRKKREARFVVTDALKDGVTIEEMRAQTLRELETVNEILEATNNAPKQQRAERERKTEIEGRLAIIEEHRKPAVAYHDARTQYEAAVAALEKENVAHEMATEFAGGDDDAWKTLRTNQHHQKREDHVEQVWFWRGQVEKQGRRLAEEQVEHDMRAFDLDAYRRGLEKKYQTLAEHEADYADSAPELLEMAFLKQKMQLFAERMEDPKLKQRLHVERERHTLARSAERTIHSITRMETVRKSLNWLNPFHWSRIRDTDAQLTKLRHDLESIQMRSKLLTTTPQEETMVDIRIPQPRTEAGTRRAAVASFEQRKSA